MDKLPGKRILFIITKSNWGGAQAYVFALATSLKQAGADVVVALGGTGRPESETGLLAERLAQAGIRMHVVSSFVREISLLREWYALRELIALIRLEQPSIVHLNSGKAGLLGALAGRIAHTPRIVFTAHGWAHRERRFFFWKATVWTASWITVVLSHAVIVVSRLDQRTAPALFFRQKVHMIHNGIMQGKLVLREEARQFLAPSMTALEKRNQWILISAELIHNKGIDIAIHAFAGVSTHCKSAALLITGAGEEHGNLARLIRSYHLEDSAFLLGFVPDVRRYLLAADIFLLPSRKEGLPLALLEAGDAGLPAIASRTGGIPEVITHEENGLLVRPGDIDGLADALTRLLSNKEEAQTFGMRLKETVHEKFFESEMLAKTAAVYIG